MTNNSIPPANTKWAGMVPVDDTALAVADTGGSGVPVLYLNGQFATMGYWRRVIAELGSGWRHITYDERGRGKKSKLSADYPPAGRHQHRAGQTCPRTRAGPVLDNITVPTRYVVASGTSFGSKGDEQERIRAGLSAVTDRNPNIKISAKVPSNHGAILRKDFRAIADAVREVGRV